MWVRLNPAEHGHTLKNPPCDASNLTSVAAHTSAVLQIGETYGFFRAHTQLPTAHGSTGVGTALVSGGTLHSWVADKVGEDEKDVQNGKWRTVLENVRTGECTKDDIIFLQSLVLSNVGTPDFSAPPWSTATVITPLASVAAAWNARAVRAFASTTGVPVFVVSAVDRPCGGAEDLNSAEEQAILAAPPHQTGNLPRLVELAVGMPVLAMRDGLWTYGRITSITLDAREADFDCATLVRYLRYQPTAVVFKEDKEPALYVLPLASTCFEWQRAGGTIGVIRRQFLVRAAYAVTAHKSSGKTFERVVVDLGTSRSILDSALAHSSLSRAPGPENVRLLQQFDESFASGSM